MMAARGLQKPIRCTGRFLLKEYREFLVKMTTKYNKVNVELKVTEKAIAFLKIEEAARRDSSNGQLDQSYRRCQFF
jgi:hypothetical protein